MSKDSISTNEELRKGDYLLSNDGNYKAIFQDDGNFVIYKWSPIWASDTVSDRPFRVLLQEDSNLVMYTQCDSPVWATDTGVNAKADRMRLTLTNQGHLVVDRNGKTVWTSATSKGRKQ